MTKDEFQDRSLGDNGAVYTTDTTAVAGHFCAITALADTVIATLVAPKISGTLTAIPLPAGVTIYGQFNGYTLTSGTVLAYRR